MKRFVYVSGLMAIGSALSLMGHLLIPSAQATYTPVPANMIAFTRAGACPAGWTEYTTARGRYIVGLPSGGTLEATTGTALSDTENRATGSHLHPFTTYSSGGSGAISVTNGQRDATAQTVALGGVQAPTGAIAGTNAPYVQLRACEKQ